ncbi:menaquinone-dependent protoporphyrinogen IX dehydrogenase [Vibrio rumoiensis]|uniref:Protoporphyrinogen IX dehydrogenase [quinone] n=1 Tax=Vibrio rumoiensis 1S-45 TaxID=1188252 RepID=A0A1E5E1A3_9VIBR|nr:menaquinone-dependent protoporphyrinogen IX dehydrogenase [Vibrio rumoiensis]OEF24343.1 protoporphyrinogen oxidase [Vibrio rumoiensis 1S-45]
MKKNIILYSTREGQTSKIANYIAEQLGLQSCDLVDLHQAEEMDLRQYEKVIIGASIRYGHFHKKLYQFIQINLDELQKAKAVFYCVNLTARKEGKDTPEGSAYIQSFLKKSPWTPDLIGVFAGALYYPRYRWFDRVMIRFIMTMTGGETDITKEVEYTDWEKVTQFTCKVDDL